MPNGAVVQCQTTTTDDSNEAHLMYAYQRLVRDMPCVDQTDEYDSNPLGTDEQTYDVVP